MGRGDASLCVGAQRIASRRHEWLENLERPLARAFRVQRQRFLDEQRSARVWIGPRGEAVLDCGERLRRILEESRV